MFCEVIKVKKLHGVDMKKVMDLQEIAEKLKELPKEELLYISGRVDSYVAMENNNQKPA